jgi:hypothetical protein
MTITPPNAPATPIFFTDECLGRLVPNALKNAGLLVEMYADWFEPGVPDTEWIPFAQERGWVILTKDAMIGRRLNEQAAIAQIAARVFIFASSGVAHTLISAAFIQAHAEMVEIATATAPPFIAKVYKSGEVKLWKDRSALRDIVSKYADEEEA